MKFAHSLCSTCTGLAMFSLATQAATLTVNPSGGLGIHPDISSAIAAATSGDTIVVQPTIYQENLVLGKDLTFVSAIAGIPVVVDGRSAGSVLICNANVTDATSFTNFEFFNGNSWNGAGALLMGADPVFVDCRFYENTANNDGGGVWSWGDPSFNNCQFYSNTAGKDGGGLYVVKGSVELIDSDLELNTADFGGGIVVDASHLEMAQSNLIDNSSTWGGGGVVAINSSTVDLHGTLFDNNRSANGGSLYSVDSTCEANACTFNNGAAWNWGGHVIGYQSEFNFENSIFESGHADLRGGMMHLVDSSYNGLENSFLNGDSPGGAMFWAERTVMDIDGSLFEGSTSVGEPFETHGRAIYMANCNMTAADTEFRLLKTSEPKAKSLIMQYLSTADYTSCTFDSCRVQPGLSISGVSFIPAAIVRNQNSTSSMVMCQVTYNNAGPAGDIIAQYGNGPGPAQGLLIQDSELKYNGPPSSSSTSGKRKRRNAVARKYTGNGFLELEDNLFCSNKIPHWRGMITNLGGNVRSNTCP
ncbi:MAG: hypothetical protein VX527_00235 [Planctomycetota bacterium]|nr:hypothetical protein [Planctomycetota bacterium]